MEAMKKIDEEIIDVDEQAEEVREKRAALVLRRAKLQHLPTTWTADNGNVGDNVTVLVEVSPQEDQYWNVAERLKRDMADAQISALWRIQNLRLWSFFSLYKDRLAMSSVDHTERDVWHGTSDIDPSMIYNYRPYDGFMSNFAAAGVWGRSIKFFEKSVNAHYYAHKPYKVECTGNHTPARHGEREMFLAKLLPENEVHMHPTGREVDCRSSTPPQKTTVSTNLDAMDTPVISQIVWIAYENGQAYPSYLVRYYRDERDPLRTPYGSRQEAMSTKHPITETDRPPSTPPALDMHGHIPTTTTSKSTSGPFENGGPNAQGTPTLSPQYHVAEILPPPPPSAPPALEYGIIPPAAQPTTSTRISGLHDGGGRRDYQKRPDNRSNDAGMPTQHQVQESAQASTRLATLALNCNTTKTIPKLSGSVNGGAITGGGQNPQRTSNGRSSDLTIQSQPTHPPPSTPPAPYLNSGPVPPTTPTSSSHKRFSGAGRGDGAARAEAAKAATTSRPVWEFEDSGWKPYEQAHQTALERKFRNPISNKLVIKTNLFTYDVDTKLMLQTNRSTGKQRQVRRRMIP